MPREAQTSHIPWQLLKNFRMLIENKNDGRYHERFQSKS